MTSEFLLVSRCRQIEFLNLFGYVFFSRIRHSLFSIYSHELGRDISSHSYKQLNTIPMANSFNPCSVIYKSLKSSRDQIKYITFYNLLLIL